MTVDFLLLSKFAKSGQAIFDGLARAEAIKVAKILLGAAVKCSNKQHFVKQITTLSPQTQKTLMQIIQSELLKEPAQTRESALIAKLEAQLEAERDEYAEVKARNAQLVSSCTALEQELMDLKEASAAAGHSSGHAAQAASEKASAEEQGLRERLRMVQDELFAREEEMVQLTAAAAEAQAKVRENRALRDELDLMREQLAEANHRAEEASKNTSASQELAVLREKLKQSQADMSESISAAHELKKLRSELATSKAEVARLQSELVDKQEALDAKVQDLERSTANYIAAKAQIGELSLQLENATAQIKQLQAQASNGASSEMAAAPAVKSLMDEMMAGDDSQRGQELEQQLRELKSHVEQLTADLDAANNRAAAAERSLQKETEASNDNGKSREEIEQLKEQLKAQSQQAAEQAQRFQAQLEAAQAKVATSSSAALPDPSAEAELTAAKEALVKVEAERDQLKHYLKLAKEKLVSKAGENTTSSAGIPANVQTELKLLGQHVHAKGMEALRLRHELDMMKQNYQQTSTSRKNGLLNHLRHQIDPYD